MQKLENQLLYKDDFSVNVDTALKKMSNIIENFFGSLCMDFLERLDNFTGVFWS